MFRYSCLFHWTLFVMKFSCCFIHCPFSPDKQNVCSQNHSGLRNGFWTRKQHPLNISMWVSSQTLNWCVGCWSHGLLLIAVKKHLVPQTWATSRWLWCLGGQSVLNSGKSLFLSTSWCVCMHFKHTHCTQSCMPRIFSLLLKIINR